jgi:hypothetical protein
MMDAKPKNRLELIKWLIFEPVLIKKYSDSLNKEEAAKEFLKSYVWIALISITVWLSFNLLTSILDLPSLIPGQYKEPFVKEWQNQPNWISRFIFVSKETMPDLAKWLAIGLVFGLVFGLASELAFGLVVGLTVGLVKGLSGWIVGWLAKGLAGGLAIGLVVGLAFGLAFGLVFRLVLGLFFGLAMGLAFGLAIGLVVGLNAGIGFFISWNLLYFRIIPFYVFHLLKGLYQCSPEKNPYRNDGGIWIPIIGLKSKLVKHSQKRPGKAFEFIDFLISYRPFQKTLAMQLTHATTAGFWREKEFHADILKKSPIISEDRPKYKPSEEWLQKLESVRNERVNYEQQSSIGYRMDYFKRYLTALKEFDGINRKKESSRWNHYYFDALDQWQSMAQEEYQQLQQLAQSQEPITRNIYRAGDALSPDFDKAIFLGREDVRDQLQHKILSSPQMPMFLIHGQRRVGKTSLLKFLPSILGSRFKTVYLDVQPMDDILKWLKRLKEEFDHTLGIHSPALSPPENSSWLDAWNILQRHLEETAKDQECKIILAFDEYEKLHYLFQKDPEAASNLLDAMRSFSQHQNKIVFLFVGAALFSELKQPDWSNYFVQAAPLLVDYLEKEDTLKLIEVAGLGYPQEVKERIFQLTVGHPTLVQRICYEMVAIANTQHRKQMTMADLDAILEKHIYRPQNGVTEVFWGQFCKSEALKTAVRQVIAAEPPTDKKALFRLTEHGFVVKEKDRYFMRVPIFEQWVKQLGDVV